MIYQYLFLLVSQRESEAMKDEELTIAQWMNSKRNNKSAIVYQYPSL